MTGNETTDAGLTPDEAHELRALLHRAADQLDVVTPSSGAATSMSTDATLRAERRRGGVRGGGRWTIGAVAAALLLLAGGVWFASGTDDAQRIATGGPDGGEESVPSPTTTGSIWRFPSELPAGMQVDRAAVAPVYAGFRFAVDDPAAPTQWLAITPTGFDLDSADRTPVASGTLAHGATYALYDPPSDSTTGATFAELSGAGGTGYVTVASVGVDHQAIIDVLADIADRAPNLTDVEAMNAALRTVALPEGLESTGDPDRAALVGSDDDPPAAFSVALSTSDGAGQVGFSTEQVGLTPAVAAIETRLQMDLDTEGDSMPERSVTTRDDIAPGALVVEMDGSNSLIVTTDDGVRIWVGDLATVTGGPSVGLPVLADLAQRLRVVPEQELRSQLRSLGIEVMDTPSATSDSGVTTTVAATPTTAAG